MNVYVITGDPVTLIDTGLPTNQSFQQLRSGLASIGFSLQDIEQVIITHMHDDHMGGITLIQKETNATVYVHEQARFEITGGNSEFVRMESYIRKFVEGCGTRKINTSKRRYHEKQWECVNYLRDGDVINAGGRNLEIIYVPGHSQTDICLWDHNSGDVFVGDFLLQHTKVNAFISPPPPGQKSRPRPLAQLRRSLLKIRNFPFKTIYPGHDNPFTDHCHVIDERLSKQEDRCRKIYEVLQVGPSSVYEISKVMFPWLNDESIFLGLSEVQGHLDLMQDGSQVCSEMVRDVTFYKLNDHS
ncbi:MBL fold metallo-hydrolase [Lentibacillus songyuanensis]|uniref:MBL fold metallo-hydrolase n=1 Tax=Lentibacillus songyuanensis TaxID=3136161 RepID=UPI0031BB0CFB